MKHYLPRFSWMQLACIVILALMCAPLIIAATSSASMVPHAGTALMSAGVLGITGMRFESADDPADPTKSSGPGIPEAIAAIEDKTLPMSQRLGVALKALQGIDPTNQLANIKSELATANTTTTTQASEITQLKADLDKATRQITALQADVTQADEARAKAEKEATDLKAKEQDIDKRADAKKKEALLALGFNSDNLPKQDPKHEEMNGEKTAEDKIRELEGSKRIQAGIYFKQHGKLPSWMN